MANAEKFDVVVYGASGYTGRLVAEYMAKQYGPDSGVRWAMAGRNKDKLEKVRDEIGAPAETPIVIADASDSGSIDAMVDAAKVLGCQTPAVGLDLLEMRVVGEELLAEEKAVKRPDPIARFQQHRHERGADIAAGTGNENTLH